MKENGEQGRFQPTKENQKANVIPCFLLRPPRPWLPARLPRGAMVILCCYKPDQENKYGFNLRKNQTSQ